MFDVSQMSRRPKTYSGPLHFYDKKNCKFKCEMGNKQLTAGGIFFFDKIGEKKGLWLLREEEYNGDVYTDFGGKYDYNDGDIFATIIREFREEVYNTEEITYKQLLSTNPSSHIFINGYIDKPVYMCVVIPYNTFPITLDPQKIERERQQVIKRNPRVPPEWYKTRSVEFVHIDDIEREKVHLSNRLKAILKQIRKTIHECSPEIQNFFSDMKI